MSKKSVDSMSQFISKVKLKKLIDELLDRHLMPQQLSPNSGYYRGEQKAYHEGYQRCLKDIQSMVNL